MKPILENFFLLLPSKPVYQGDKFKLDIEVRGEGLSRDGSWLQIILEDRPLVDMVFTQKPDNEFSNISKSEFWQIELQAPEKKGNYIIQAVFPNVENKTPPSKAILQVVDATEKSNISDKPIQQEYKNKNNVKHVTTDSTSLNNTKQTQPRKVLLAALIALVVSSILGIGIFFAFLQKEAPVQVALVEPFSQSFEAPIIPTPEKNDNILKPLIEQQVATNNSFTKIHKEKIFKQALITDLLSEAKKMLSDPNLTQTSITWAKIKYEEVLIIEPDNTEAKHALENVAKSYIKLLDQSLIENNFSNAQRYLQLASAVLPTHSSLQPAQKRIKVALAQQKASLLLIEKNNKIDQLLKAATADFKALRFSKPINENAITRYQQILLIDPDNADAKQGLENIAQHYLKMTKDALSKQHWKSVDKYLIQLSALKADSSQLQLLQKKITKAKFLQQQKKTNATQQHNHITQLLSLAENDINVSRIHTPKNQNAVAKYNSVLAIEPTNKQALAGLDKIVAIDIQLATSAIDNLRFTEAQHFINQAESVTPKAVQSIQKRLDKAKSLAQKPSAIKKVTTNNPPTKPSLNNVPLDRIAVIVHPSSPLSDISSEQLKSIYIGQQQKWSTGKKIIVVNLPPDSKAREKFYKVILNAKAKRVFTTHFFGSSGSMPFKTKVRLTDNAVKKIIRRNKKAIAYIYLNNADSSVKVLTINGHQPLSDTYLLH